MARAVLVLLGIAALGAGAWHFKDYEPGFDYGVHHFDVSRLNALLEKEPCDRAKIVELGEAMMRAGDYRGAAKRAAAFFAACGEHERLRWVSYGAYKRLSDFPQAIAEASKLVELDPNDKDYWWWRASVKEQAGELEGAVADYRQALAVSPALTNIPFNLAGVLERLGRPCDAIFPVEQFLHHHPQHLEDEGIRQRLQRYYESPGCGGLAGSGKAELKFNPADTLIRARVKVNDKEAGTFAVDTGASYVALSRRFAERLGLDPARMAEVLVGTAGGLRKGRLTRLTQVDVQGVSADRVEAVVMDQLPPGLDGLLGLSFLTRFSLTLDRAAGIMRIESRR